MSIEPDAPMQHEPQQQATPSDPTPLQPALQDAERLLRESLGQVCATDPMRADTGEMIRLDEVLAIAGEAAKRAVSLRRRMRQEGRAAPRPPRTTRGRAGRSQESTSPPTVVPEADAPVLESASQSSDSVTLETPDDHRSFRDSRGVVWSVWAVHPQPARGGRAGLRGSFVQGWLAFVCEAEKRRLSPVPDDWTTLDEAALEQLCAAAEAARLETPTRRMPRIDEGEAT